MAGSPGPGGIGGPGVQRNRELIEEMRWQLAKIKDKQAENNELLGKLDAVRADLAALEATATSPDRTVTVTAGAGGIVRSVTLTDDAMRLNAATLSAAINATIGGAIAHATSQQLNIVHAEVGPHVEPEQILGPQAKIAAFGEAGARAAAQPQPAPPVAPPPAEPAPFAQPIRTTAVVQPAYVAPPAQPPPAQPPPAPPPAQPPPPPRRRPDPDSYPDDDDPPPSILGAVRNM